MPREPSLAYRRALTTAAQPGRDQADRLVALRGVVDAFPDYAPVRNTYAYALWNAGDQAGALHQVQEYMRLLPNHPNPHDSYAEMVQFEVQVLMGRSDLARATITAAAAANAWPGDAGGHRRLAATFVIDGNAKAALPELGLAADAAKAATNPGLEGFLHLQAALVDLHLGTGKVPVAHGCGGHRQRRRRPVGEDGGCIFPA